MLIIKKINIQDKKESKNGRDYKKTTLETHLCY